LYIKTAAFVFLVGGYTIYNLARDSLKATEGLLANPNSRILTETPEAFCPVKAADPTYMVVVYFFGVIYLFIGLAVIADDFFCPALDILADDLHLSQDVAGATLMAAGGSAPELFANLIGTFIRSDVGFGTIVGSAVFNVLFVVGFCSLVTDTPMKLTAWPLLRDSSFYSLTLCILALFFGVFSPQKIELFEAVILFALYWL
jgi:Ca2+/Na+ antiporter